MKKIIEWNRNISIKIIGKLDSMFVKPEGVEDYFNSQISNDYSKKIVLEIGGTSRPLFSKDLIECYLGMDIDKKFDFKTFYHQYYPQSCEEQNSHIKADFIFSKYLLEHVPDNVKTFKNIENWLNPGGISIHIFPLSFHPFSLANRIIGNGLAKKLIPILRPGKETITGYPAFYDKCNYFELEKIKKSSKLKYDIKYFFEAEDYFSFFFPFSLAIYFFNRVCKKSRFFLFASNAVLIIRKN